MLQDEIYALICTNIFILQQYVVSRKRAWKNYNVFLTLKLNLMYSGPRTNGEK